MIHWIDALILIAFIGYAVFTGFKNKSKASENLEEYFLAGRSLKGWQAGRAGKKFRILLGPLLRRGRSLPRGRTCSRRSSPEGQLVVSASGDQQFLSAALFGKIEFAAIDRFPHGPQSDGDQFRCLLNINKWFQFFSALPSSTLRFSCKISRPIRHSSSYTIYPAEIIPNLS